jgi:hypothetical protein
MIPYNRPPGEPSLGCVLKPDSIYLADLRITLVSLEKSCGRAKKLAPWARPELHHAISIQNCLTKGQFGSFDAHRDFELRHCCGYLADQPFAR